MRAGQERSEEAPARMNLRASAEAVPACCMISDLVSPRPAAVIQPQPGKGGFDTPLPFGSPGLPYEAPVRACIARALHAKRSGAYVSRTEFLPGVHLPFRRGSIPGGSATTSNQYLAIVLTTSISSE